MSVFGVKLPDVGEGVAEAELVEWHVVVGDTVTTESVLAEVMTDKATVEISSPVNGVIAYLHGEPGDTLAVGAAFVGVELGDGAAPQSNAAAPQNEPTAPPPAVVPVAPRPIGASEAAPPEPAASPGPVLSGPVLSGQVPSPRPTAAPAVRARARALGIDLAAIAGSGPAGRVLHGDLDRVLAGSAGRVGEQAADTPRVEAVRGLRRRIAARLTTAWTEIPHITYVDAVDVTDLEALRGELNARDHPSGERLTMLPFLVRAIVLAVAEQPRLNAHYDATAQSLAMFDAVHVGIATQTPDGLVVPVLRHAESRGLWELAGEIRRVADVARSGAATMAELGGSTITVTSLGALGGLVTTPIINRPEVVIVGVNKIETRPVWRDGAFVPRQMVNLSSSFDHRIVDGWDAATFVQRVRALLEMPALLFIDDHG